MKEWHEQVRETTYFGWSTNLCCFEIAVQWCYVLEIMQSWCHSELQMFSCMGQFCLKTWSGLYLLDSVFYGMFQQVSIKWQPWSCILLLCKGKRLWNWGYRCIFHLDFCLLISFSSYWRCLGFFFADLCCPSSADRGDAQVLFFFDSCLSRLWGYFYRAWKCFAEG